MAIYNVRDYGATGDGSSNDRAAIQRALDDAYTAGGGSVYLPAGTYAIAPTAGTKATYAGLQIRDNVTVYGDGMGDTVIKVMDGYAGGMTGIMRTPYGQENANITVRDLTLDGNRANTTGKVDGWFNGFIPGQDGKDTNITLERMEIKNASGYGFDPHEQTVGLVIRDSVAHGNGLDGFVADYIVDGLFENNVSYGNDRHGFNIVTSTNDFTMRNNVAYDNNGGGIVIQRGTDNIPSPQNILIEGGEVYGNALEGILIKMSDNVTVSGVKIYENGTYGIRLHGSSNSTIEDNEVFDNSQSQQAGYDQIRIQIYDDLGGVSNKIFDAKGNLVSNNTLYGNSSIQTGWGIREMADGSDFNTVTNNTVSGSAYGTVRIAGANSVESGNSGTTVEPVATNDLLTGTELADKLDGKGGADTIDGAAGADTLIGGAGADIFRISSLEHSNRVNGADRITDFSMTDDKIDLTGLGFTTLINGTKTQAGELRLASSASTTGARTYVRNDQTGFELLLLGDYLNLTNNSFVFGSGGTDTTPGGGTDTTPGGGGTDTTPGGGGTDTTPGGGTDTTPGGGGTDTTPGGGTDTIPGGGGTDTTPGGGGTNTPPVSGGGGSPTPPPPVVETPASVTIRSLSSSGLLTGSRGLDQMQGSEGNDTLMGGTGLGDPLDISDTIAGGGGADEIYGNGGDDLLFGGNSAADPTDAGDLIVGGFGNDLIYGNGGNDQLLGSHGLDEIYGGVGDDTIFGGTGEFSPDDDADALFGNEGNDLMFGNGGNDSLIGGLGSDTLFGGAGSDTFLFEAGAERDVIGDFTAGADLLAVSLTLGASTQQVLDAITYLAGGRAVIELPNGAIELQLTADGNAQLTAADLILV